MSTIWKCELCGTKYEFPDDTEPECDCIQPRKRVVKQPFEFAEETPRKRRAKPTSVAEDTSFVISAKAGDAWSLMSNAVLPALASDVAAPIMLLPLRQYSDLYVMPKLRLNLVRRLRPMPEPHKQIRCISIDRIVAAFVQTLCQQLRIPCTKNSDSIVVDAPQTFLDWILPAGWEAVYAYAFHEADSVICVKSRNNHACVHYKQRVLESLRVVLRYPSRLHVTCIVQQLDYFGQPMKVDLSC